MNWPGMNSSRGSRRSGLFQFAAFESPRCATIALLLVDQRHAAVQVGDDDEALVLVEVARQPEAGDEIDVLAVEREALQAVVAAIGDDQRRASRRACRSRCRAARSACPGSEPRPPNVRMCSALAVVLIDVERAVAVRRHRRRRSARWRCWSGCSAPACRRRPACSRRRPAVPGSSRRPRPVSVVLTTDRLQIGLRRHLRDWRRSTVR